MGMRSSEPQTRRPYDLVIKIEAGTDGRREEFDAILSRYHVDFDLRSSSDESISYEVRCPIDMNREDVTNTILRLDPEGHGSVDWSEKKAKAK